MNPETWALIGLPALMGGIGGASRGVIGLLKALSLRRRIIWFYYAITVLVAIIIGIFVGIIFNFDLHIQIYINTYK